jgi:hypothetical protein
MKLCATLFIFLFWINLNQVAWGGEQYGQPLSLNEITKISEIEKNPEAFVGRKVRLTGIVVEVCAKRGCWLDLASDTLREVPGQGRRRGRRLSHVGPGPHRRGGRGGRSPEAERG